MKRSMITFGIGIFLVTTQISFAQSPTSQPTAIKLDAAEHNFGKVWAGSLVTHTFRFTNASDKPINIKNVSTSCGCTTTRDYARTVAPGAMWELAATFNTKGQRGTVSKKITVVTDAASQPSIIFTIAGEVATRYKAEPNPSFIFGRIKGDAPETRTLTITSQIDTPLILSKARADSEQFFVDLKEIEKGKKYEIAVATIPPLKEGTTTGKVIIETNVPEEPKIELYVSATVPSRLALTPPMVYMPEARSNDTKTTATMRNDGETPVRIKEIRTCHPAIKTEYKPVFEGKLYQITVTVPKDLAIGTAGHTVTVVTDDAEKPSLTLPIRLPGSTASAGTSTSRPVDMLIGKQAPAFKLTTASGKPLSNKELAGTITVLNFFSPGCGFCKKQMPRIEPIRTAYEPKGIRFVHVSERMGSKTYTKEEVLDLLKNLGVNADWALDADNATGETFKANSYPTMVIVGKTGTVEAVNSGNKDDLETLMKTQLDALLSGKPAPKVAVAPSQQ